MPSHAEILETLAEALEVTPEQLTPETRIADVEEWNSIGWLTVMSMADERWNMQMGASDIRGFQTVMDVVSYIEERAKTG